MNKKGASFFYENWPEVIGFVLLIFGFFISIRSGSAFMNYLIIFLSGMVFGRLWWQKRHRLKMPLFIMTLTYLVGFILGSIYGNKNIILIAFVVGFVVSQQLHKEHIIDW